MIDFQVIDSRRTNRGLVVLDVNVGGQNQSWTYKGIRAGVIWQPIPYYVILGELQPSKFDTGITEDPFYLLDEFEGRPMATQDLLEHLSDSILLLKVNDIYADMKDQEHVDLFYQYRERLLNFQIGLIHPPLFDNFRAAVSQVQEAIRNQLLRIPRHTLVWTQLEDFNLKDIDQKPEEKFYHLRALSFVICGFKKFKPVQILKIGEYSERRPTGGTEGWMAG